MKRDVAAKRYAEAAYLIAREDGKEEEWAAGLHALASLYSDEAARAILESARVSPDRKRELVEAVLADAEPNVRNLALLLLRRGRLHLAPQLAESYQELLDASKGISHAVVTSAVPLSSDEQAAVQRKLEEIAGGPVVMSTDVDEGIIGGLVVRIGDRLIDGSTRSRLVALKQQLAGAPR